MNKQFPLFNPIDSTPIENENEPYHLKLCFCPLCEKGINGLIKEKSRNVISWQFICRVILYSLSILHNSTDYFSLKYDVHWFIVDHWYLFSQLEQFRTNPNKWKKSILDAMIHSNLFESGKSNINKTGIWKLKNVENPWNGLEDIKLNKNFKNFDSFYDWKNFTKNNLNESLIINFDFNNENRLNNFNLSNAMKNNIQMNNSNEIKNNNLNNLNNNNNNNLNNINNNNLNNNIKNNTFNEDENNMKNNVFHEYTNYDNINLNINDNGLCYESLESSSYEKNSNTLSNNNYNYLNDNFLNNQMNNEVKNKNLLPSLSSLYKYSMDNFNSLKIKNSK